MFDDLRKQAEGDFDEPEVKDNYSFKDTASQAKNNLFGMTPAQRLVIAFMLLLMAVILSSMCLLVTEKIVLPFVP